MGTKFQWWNRQIDWFCVLSPCAVSMVWWRWPQCVAARWPDTLECHHSWQKCLGTTATAVTAAMRIRIHAIDCGDPYRLHRALVHILYQKMARQGLLVVGYTEVWQGMMLLNDVSYVLQTENCLRNHSVWSSDIWFQSSQLGECNCFHLCLCLDEGRTCCIQKFVNSGISYGDYSLCLQDGGTSSIWNTFQ